MDNASALFELFILAMPVACIAWTVTHEEVFREPRQWCEERSRTGRTLVRRKFFYLFTCEYCFSHYVGAAFVVLSHFTFLFDDWRGTVIAWFAVVWVANVYISAFGRLRLDIKRESVDIAATQASTLATTTAHAGLLIETPLA